jgi:hypothetical protein
VIALLLLAGGCATKLGPPQGSTLERACWPTFRYQDGWLGGDGAYSVPLADGRSLWLFGDTFVGAPGALDRRGARFIHNSVGVSTCHPDGRFEVAYFWGRGDDGAPRAILDRGDASRWWWLSGGFQRGDRLSVGLLEVEAAPARGALSLPFRITGTSIAEIRDASLDPRDWKPRVLPLSSDASAFPLAAQVVSGAHLYHFGFLERGDQRPRFLARLPLAAFDAATPDLPGAIETLGAGGRWLPGLQPDAALILMEDSATEMSVAFHATDGRWVALYNHAQVDAAFPKARPSDAIYARTAERLEGPWSPPQLIFRIPELAPGRGDPNTGCYAAKEQPAFSRPGSATFTYVCNLFTGPGEDPFAVLRRLQTQMELYRPIPATVTLPDPSASRSR